MRQTIKKFIPLLEMLQHLDEKNRRQYLKSAKNDLIKFLSEIVYNLNIGSLIPPSLDKFRPFKKNIQRLSNRSISLAQRKKILSSSNFFSNVISPLIPILIELIQ